ncbi:CubicO group peptidase (beta-lactamase class C family) [Gillisia sp. Hel_I_86]|uniref:serine hydrolase domain-containing protein n=1 Tax=Gillisia sp. Hel_I_86 TaxID=1249981 RepID=UPI00119B1FFA|nr:serine hydrolase [Gillisia sp. Hel_I_86]TVZ26391.1 CubicO group peptidase (beta-lactamase class C family) [Gillisia sp. Hel_I_86]
MKLLLKIIGGFLATILLIVVLLFLFDYDYLLKGIQVVYFQGHKTAYIDDYTEFENRVIESGENFDEWPLSPDYNKTTPAGRLQKTNEELGTVAFLIIKNDSIWYEKYAPNYGIDSKTNSFSMAKSITVALLGKAIKDAYIKSLNQPVGDFLPEFNKDKQAALTVGDLASMSSGLNWDEDYYNPFSQTAKAYFGDDIRKEALNLKVIEEPGNAFKYLSGNTILLGMVIEKATGQELSTYLSDSFWKPLGMKENAFWQLDSEESGMEKAYCCIASNARDFARFGKLFKDNGKWNGEQLLDSEFVETATKARFEDSPQYGYGFWLSDYKGKEIFYMRGILGQYVIVVPEDDLIIVRLGHELIPRKEGENHAKDFFIYIDEAYKMLANGSKTAP